jgi:DNA gyrase/topoisomerase IV subunit A
VIELEKVTKANPAGGSYTRDMDDESTRNLRRQIDRETRIEIKELRKENKNYLATILQLEAAIDANRKDFEHSISEIRKDFETFVNQSKVALNAAQTVADAGFIGRNVIYGLAGLFAAFGGAVAAWNVISEYFKK